MSDLDVTLRRILGGVRRESSEKLGPVVKCVRCRDTRLIELVAGEFTSLGGHRLTASERHPVYRQCLACRPTAVVDESEGRRFS